MLFIKALACVHSPKTTSSISNVPSFHFHPALVHSLG